MLKRHPRISKGWEQWSRSELLLLNVSHRGSFYQADLGQGLSSALLELSRDASAVGWRTTLWVAGPVGDDLRCSRAHQACEGLVSAYLSSPKPHPWTQPPLDIRGWSWPLLSIPLPLRGISPPYDLPPLLTPTYCPATWQTGLSMGPEVISSLKPP